MAIASIINKRISLVCGSGTRGRSLSLTKHRPPSWHVSMSKAQARQRLRPLYIEIPSTTEVEASVKELSIP
ncbi:hypothetical protein D5086_015745 [Populus alba]|uniref:Uncharacterized protein n=1 Tax=Populus alba TaxID=43335 RepID=A0ACC4BS18_POPAL